MKTRFFVSFAVALLAGGLAVSTLAQRPTGPGGGPGSMMGPGGQNQTAPGPRTGPGYGGGYGGGYGPGMMGPGYGGGYGPGMMMGPGMMGPGYGGGYGPGMMMGPGMMGPGYGGGHGPGMRGPGYGGGYGPGAMADADNNGIIDENEEKRFSEWRFRHMDWDNDGKFSLDEISGARVPSGAGYWHHHTEENHPMYRFMENRFKAMDANGDGTVTREEFVSYGAEKLKKSDDDKDGKVSIYEYNANMWRN